MEVKITDNSDIFKRAKDEAIERALEAIGLTAERHAKEQCPVDTGRLRNSISHAYVMSERAAYIGTNVEYAKYVETREKSKSGKAIKHKSGKAHFLRDAASQHSDEYKSIVEAQLRGGA